jgi:hypothetical protein
MQPADPTGSALAGSSETGILRGYASTWRAIWRSPGELAVLVAFLLGSIALGRLAA